MIKDSLDVGIVIERRDEDNRWIDHSWHVVDAIAGAPPVDDWLELDRGERWVRYHAATLPLEIFKGETEGYKVNLSLEPPVIFVVIDTDSDDDDDGRPIEISHATVCPYEAQDYLDASENVVESVAMPAAVCAWLAAFVDAHHVDKPFKKRKREPHPGKRDASNELILPPKRRAGDRRGR